VAPAAASSTNGKVVPAVQSPCVFAPIPLIKSTEVAASPSIQKTPHKKKNYIYCRYI
jgi:hypothetical protein